MKKLPIIFILGPTTSGKTKLSIKLKSIYSDLEIINVDSTSIYRDMNIGTSKPNINILKKFPHKLIDIRDPSQKYSVFDFYNDSIYLINKFHNKKKIPMFSGGNLFYFYTLLNGINLFKYNKNIVLDFIGKKFNNKKKKIIENINYLFKNTKNININNYYRYKKIIYIYLMYGKINYNIYKLEKKYKIYKFYLLNNNINENFIKNIKYRFYKMLKNGLELEVRKLYNRKDLNINMQSIKSIGYKQMWLYFSKKLSYNEFIDKSIIDTLNLFKSQIKWIKKFNNLMFIENKKDFKEKILNNIDKIINNYI